MSWNKTDKTKSTSFNDNKDFNNVQNLFLELLQKYEVIKEYHGKLNGISYTEYEIESKKHRPGMLELPKQFENLRKQLSNFKKESDKYDENTNDQIQVIENSLKQKEGDFQNLLNEIVSKEKSLSKRFSLINLPENSTQVSDLSSLDDRKTSVMKTEYRNSAFIQEDMSEEFIYMDQRQKDLEEICKVSSQIKNITDSMVVETAKQGQDIELADKNISEAKENALQADKEIIKADKDMSSTNKSMYAIVGLILFVVIFVVVLVILVVK